MSLARPVAMYSTCLHCNGALGRNDTVEHFTVGRRLAFDAAKGRLWVVCPRCQRWNLTPLEARWEAIEECERLFATAKVRRSTDNVGVARVHGRMDLVRLGKPARREVAAWRYGRELWRRWSWPTLLTKPQVMTEMGTVSIAGAVFLVASGSVAIAGSAFFGAMSLVLTRVATRDVRARIVLPDGQVTDMRSLTASDVSMAVETAADGGWALRCSRASESYLNGESESVPTLRGVLAFRNALAGNRDMLARAVERVQGSSDARAFIHRTARAAQESGLAHLSLYPSDALLALEMALHEVTESDTLDGELQGLADEWELAEEVAAIADDMFLPEPVRARFTEISARRGERSQ
jgi:hypothetical protein